MTRGRTALIAVTVAVLGLQPCMAHGQTLYGLTAIPPQQWITIDTTTGAGILVGKLASVPGNGLTGRFWPCRG